MGLGSIGVIELARARIKADAARAQLDEGIDPIDQRRLDRARRAVSDASVVTFKEAATRFLDAHLDTWKNPKHRQQWENTLRNYAFPVFGDLPVAEVDKALVLRVIEPIWKTKTETANRVRSRIERVLDWARARDLRTGDNPARWKGGLSHVLPARKAAQRVRHHPAMPYRELPAFMAALHERVGMGARALEFTILTAARTSETLHATWSEIDLAERVWLVPAERMKAGRDHRVPLSDVAIDVLKKVQIGQQCPLVFPGEKNKPLSTNTMRKTLLMTHPKLTVHGFRSSFADWSAEQTQFAREVTEAALAHVVGDKTEAAYRRGDMIDKRRLLMDAWAEYCSQAEGSESNV